MRSNRFGVLRLCVVAGLLVVWCARNLVAQAFFMNVVGNMGRQNEIVPVTVLFDTDQDLDGWTIALCHDPDSVLPTDQILGRDAIAFPPDFVPPDIVLTNVGADFVAQEVVVDPVARLSVLPAGMDREVLIVFYRLVAPGPGSTIVQPCDGVAQVIPGGPTVNNQFVLAGGMVIGQPQGLLLSGATIEIFPGGGAQAGPALPFSLGFPLCNDFELPPDGVLNTVIDCTVIQGPAAAGLPIQGWSIGVSAEGVQIAGITTDGTVGDDFPDGLRMNGFEKSELTTAGMGDCVRPGAVSSVILSFTAPIEFTASAPTPLAKITLAGRAPSVPGARSPGRLFYVDGCAGSGGPITNGLVVMGATLGAELGECNFEIIAESAPVCPENLRCRVDQGNKSVDLSWDPPETAGLRRYDLFRNGEHIANIAPFRSSFLDFPPMGNLTQPVVFNYELAAVFDPAPRAPCVAGPCRGPCVGLRCSAVVTPGQVAFEESFEGAAVDDAALAGAGWIFTAGAGAPPFENAAWSLANQGRRRAPPGLNGRPSQGRFLTSDSKTAVGMNETGTGMSHEIITPPFNCSTFDAVWLHMDCLVQFANDGDAVFAVDVCNTGACDGPSAPWQNVFQRVSPGRTLPPLPDSTNGSGFYGRLDVDLTAFAAGQPSVRVRLRHFEPTNDFWVSADNLVVDDVVPFWATVRSPPQLVNVRAVTPNELLMGEDFGPSGIPGTWEVTSLEGLSLWQDDACDEAGRGDGTGVNRMDDNFAMMDTLCTSTGPEEDELVTPSADCSDYEEVILVFEDEALWKNDEFIYEIFLSLDGGITFEGEALDGYFREASWQACECSYYAQQSVSVPAAALEPNVSFVFRFSGIQNTGWWAVDKVELWGRPAREFRRGDSNANGAVEIGDAIVIFNFLFTGGAAPACKAAANVDGGSNLDLSDAVRILNFLFQGGAPPTSPYPSCGPVMNNPDAVVLGCTDQFVCPP